MGFELIVVRWLHVLAGIAWIGLLYYFNFVQGPALAKAKADGTAAHHVAPARCGPPAVGVTGAVYLMRPGSVC